MRPRDWLDPRLAPWWTRRSVPRRLAALLMAQAGPDRISPGCNFCSDLATGGRGSLDSTVCMGDPGAANAETAARHAHALGEEGEVVLRLMLCGQGYQELQPSRDVSPRRVCRRDAAPPLFCSVFITFPLHPFPTGCFGGPFFVRPNHSHFPHHKRLVPF